MFFVGSFVEVIQDDRGFEVYVLVGHRDDERVPEPESSSVGDYDFRFGHALAERVDVGRVLPREGRVFPLAAADHDGDP